MTALGSVQSQSERELKKVTIGDWGVERAKAKATFLHSAACSDIELQGCITRFQSYPSRCLYGPTSSWKWLFFFFLRNCKNIQALSPRIQSTATHKCDLPGMWYVWSTLQRSGLHGLFRLWWKRVTGRCKQETVTSAVHCRLMALDSNLQFKS